MADGVAAYASDVRTRAYPGPEHAYSVDADELADFRAGVKDLLAG
jgi:3-methyl-2-oxobutanoate hydroxymethyltransferase